MTLNKSESLQGILKNTSSQRSLGQDRMNFGQNYQKLDAILNKSNESSPFRAKSSLDMLKAQNNPYGLQQSSPFYGSKKSPELPEIATPTLSRRGQIKKKQRELSP